jgi:hypothetical protein
MLIPPMPLSVAIWESIVSKYETASLGIFEDEFNTIGFNTSLPKSLLF